MNDLEVVRLSQNDVQVARQLAAEFLAEPAVAPERLADLLDDERNIVLTAMRDGAPVGYLVAHRFPSLAGERLVYLYDIEVHPALRRRGIGSRLVSLLKEICVAQGVDSIWVGSSLTNVAACTLWSRTGAERESDQFVEFTYEL
ncbi:MAG: GNAT family N-acetyltransferase [Blastocatellia bacterium]